jgi:hypothetical protein
MTDARPLAGRRRLLIAGAAACGAATLPGALRWGRHALLPLSTTPAAMADTPVTIALGDPQQFDLHAPGARIDRQPVGMDFYERDWPPAALATLRYLQGPHSFEIPWVSSVMGCSNPRNPDEGIYAWNIDAFALPGDRMPHKLARDGLFALLRQLLRAGWQRFLLASEPRLVGRAALRYFVEQGGTYPLDPAFPLDLEQWMRINLDLPYWQLWADGVYMTLRVIDEPALRDPQGQGVYMFTIDLESEAAFFRGYFREVEDMRQWKERIAAELERYRHLRPRKEAELRLQGYTIDETYRDPPVLALRQTHAR